MTVETVDAGPEKVCRSAIVHASPEELFEIVAQPREHHELDGSGTVGTTISGPIRLSAGQKFTTHMKQYGFPYSITSTVTDFAEGRVIEWQHPMGHRWRWEFAPSETAGTLVTETFDYSTISSSFRRRMLRLIGQVRKNEAGIEHTLANLQERYAAS